MKEILRVVGKPHMGDFDKSFYSDDHDVPALWIGGQIVAIGDGSDDYGVKHEGHLRWKLDGNKEYEIIIRELEVPP